MKLHPKIKTICEEYAESYEWIENDSSLFINTDVQFAEIIMARLEKCPLEFVNIQHKQIKNKVNIWFRLKEEEEKSYDFEDDGDDGDDNFAY